MNESPEGPSKLPEMLAAEIAEELHGALE